MADWERSSSGSSGHDWERAPTADAPKEPDAPAPTAAPVKAGPGPTKPTPADFRQSTRDLGQATRGVVSGIIGAPGALEQFGLDLGNKIGATNPGETPFFPTPDRVNDFMGKFIGKSPNDPRSTGIRTGGEVLGGLLTPSGVMGVVRGAAKGIPSAIGTMERLAPGAAARSQKVLAEVGTPSDASTLGSKIYNDLASRINQLVAKRHGAAESDKAKYFNQPKDVEADAVDAYHRKLADIAFTEERDLSPEQLKALYDSSSHLKGDRSIKAMETERRRLGDIASGKMEGYDAIGVQFAKRMKDELTKVLADKVPASKSFIENYEAASAPLDMFDTTLGKKVTKRASDYLPNVPAIDPKVLPSAMFKSKFSINQFKALADDPKIVNGAASEHVATELMDKNADQARAWLTKNRDWLDEVPSVKKDAEAYVKRLEDVQHTRGRAKTLAVATGGAGAIGGLYSGLRDFGVIGK